MALRACLVAIVLLAAVPARAEERPPVQLGAGGTFLGVAAPDGLMGGWRISATAGAPRFIACVLDLDAWYSGRSGAGLYLLSVGPRFFYPWLVTPFVQMTGALLFLPGETSPEPTWWLGGGIEAPLGARIAIRLGVDAMLAPATGAYRATLTVVFGLGSHRAPPRPAPARSRPVRRPAPPATQPATRPASQPASAPASQLLAPVDL
jgi:hypothetical protein